jgi:hypothetical protein
MMGARRMSALALALVVAAATAVAQTTATSSEVVTGVVDTMSSYATREELLDACALLRAALTGCGRSDDTVRLLLRDVEQEYERLRVVFADREACNYALAGGSLGAGVGTVAGCLVQPPRLGCLDSPCVPGGIAWGWLPGGIIGTVVGMMTGIVLRNRRLAERRSGVNGLIRRANRVLISMRSSAPGW